MMGHKTHIVLIVIILILLGLVAWVLLRDKINLIGLVDVPETRCLQENEFTEYSISGETGVSTGTVTVFVKDKITKETHYSFTETLLQPGHYHPIELHECSVYFVKGFNYDATKLKKQDGFRAELTKFTYRGEKRDSILTTKQENGEYYSFYSRDFRVSPNEKWVVFERSYWPQPEYAIAIKDFASKEDVLIVPASEILEKYDVGGNFSPLHWTKDSGHLWLSFYDGAYPNGWMKINSSDWSYEVYPAREGMLNGYPPNFTTGWVPFIPGAFWTGVDIGDEQVKQQRIAEGSTADLYLYNMFTKEEVLVDDTDEPIWRGLNATWLDDFTLEYHLPSGERKTYSIPQVR